MKDKLVKINIHESIKNKAAEIARDLGLKDYVFYEDALIAHIQKMRPEANKRKKERGLQ